MAEKLKYTAAMLRKGLDNTGFDESWAQRAGANLDGHTLMIIEVKHADKIVDGEGDELVRLKVVSVEPVPDAQENVVREFVRAIARQRRVDDGQLALTDEAVGSEDAVTNAAAALEAQIDKGDDGEVTGTWDGNPDATLTCPAIECTLPQDHDGPHGVPVEAPSNVAQFSAPKTKTKG